MCGVESHADLLNAGFSTLRITDHRLKHQPTKEAVRLRDILRSRSAVAAVESVT